MSKIEKIRKENEELFIKFQTFCMNPLFDDFNKICHNKKIINNTNIDFKTWYNAAILKYNFENILNYEIKDIGNIKKQFDKSPTKSLLKKIWALFFVTGEYEYQELGYLFIGHELVSNNLKEYASDYYLYIKDLYNNRIKKISNPKIDMEIINFKYIEYKAKILGDKSENIPIFYN